MLIKGTEFVRQLLATEPFISEDGRALTADIARDQYIFCAGAPEITDLHDEGVGLHVVNFPASNPEIHLEFTGVTSTCCGDGIGKTQLDNMYDTGTGGPYLYLNAPNPNAAKVLLNWIGTRQGNETYLVETGQVNRHCSGRVDLQRLCATQENMEDGKSYIGFVHESSGHLVG